MLSPSEGQGFASDLGFSMPSDDVQEAETLDVISRWAVITAMGLLEDILESSDWLCELQDGIAQQSDEVKHAFHKTITSYGVALVNKLLDSGKIMIVVEDSDE